MKGVKNKWIFASIILFALFLANIIFGKIILSFNSGGLSVFNEVAEFLMLLIAVICFVFGISTKNE